MKILLVNTFYYPNMVGGTEHSIKLLAEGLNNIGHDVYVLTGDGTKDEIEKYIVNGINIIRVNAKNKFNSGAGKIIRKTLEFENIVLKKKLESVIDEIKPDIIHTNNLFYISNIVWKIANKKNIKVVHTIRDYWGICPKCTLLNRNKEICNKCNVLCNIHKKNYKLKSKYVDLVTAPSKFTLDIYNENKLYQDIPNILVYNAIDVDIEEHREILKNKLSRKEEKIKFLFMGSLETHKGIKFIIETFMKVKNDNIELFICGVGSLSEYVEKSCDIDNRIIYKGKVEGKEKTSILVESDVMIVPSIWYEPFGRVVIEGYKYAMPVIACNIGGIKELLTDEVSVGVDANSMVQLKNAIETLSSKENIDKYIVNTEKFIKKYNLDDQINSFNKIYEDITDKK